MKRASKPTSLVEDELRARRVEAVSLLRDLAKAASAMAEAIDGGATPSGHGIVERAGSAAAAVAMLYGANYVTALARADSTP